MFLCRRSLLQVHAAKLLASLSATKAPFSARTQARDGDTDTYPVRTAPSRALERCPSTGTVDLDPLPNKSVSELLLKVNELSGPSRCERPKNGSRVSLNSRANSGDQVEAYISLRLRDRQLMKDLPTRAFTVVARKAAKESLNSVVDNVAADVIEVYRGSDIERAALIRELLKLSCSHSALRDNYVLELFKSLPTPDPLPPLSSKILARVTKAILAQSPSSLTSYVPLLESIVPMLVSHPRETLPFRYARGEKYLDPPPNDHVWLTFRLLQLVLASGEAQRALGVLQTLIHAEKIPASALQASDHASEDFNLIIITALVRACLQYSWRNGAAQLLQEATRTSHTSREQFSSLAGEVMDAFFESGSTSDAENCGNMILSLVSADSGVILSDRLVVRFYDMVRQAGRGDLAEQVYCHLRSTGVKEKHQYPPPRGPVLTWLMEHFLQVSFNIHAARTLAQHVVETAQPLSETIRPSFISMCAKYGFSTQARVLWERYAAVGRNRNMIVGHASLMLRMVSLFSSFGRHRSNSRNPSLDGSYFEAAKLKTNVEGKFTEPSKDVKGASNVPKSTETVGVEFALEYRDNEEVKFAQYVLNEFRRIKEPLANASHMDLNALARGHSILGDIKGCLEALKVVLDRHEIPDIYDINVALAAMAKQHPRGGAQMIERMMENGVEPNGVTFSTVINAALADGDEELAREVMEKAGALGWEGLTEKGVASMLHATLRGGGTGTGSMARAYEVISERGKSGTIHTAEMGKKCVQAALRANEPVVAFKFWKLLIKDKTEWGHRGQVTWRRMMADKIRKESKEGRIDEYKGRQMLEELTRTT